MENHIKQIITKQRGITLNYQKRIEILDTLYREIDTRSEDIAKALELDLRKSRFESYMSEIDICLHEIRTFKSKLKKWMKPKKVSTSLLFMPARSYIHHEAYGTVLIISPWNYPIQLALMPLIGAIAAGNTIVLKPSEMAPETSRVIKDIISNCIEERYIAVIEGGVQETTVLLEQKFDYIFYTGNGHVARIIMQAAAKNLTPVTLELGGKSPCFVFNENIQISANRIMWGKFFNAGQTCVSPDYILIEESKRDVFVEACRKSLKSFYGDNIQDSPDYGRIVNERHFTRLSELINKDNILVGGNVDKASLYIEPTIVSAEGSDAIMKEEIFGPILPIISVSNLDEAISFAKEGDKPLACYAFMDNKSDMRKLNDSFSSGGLVYNDTVIHLSNNNLPFGGVGESGTGMYHGKFSFETFSHRKAVMKRSFLFENSLRYPPYKGKLKLIRRLMAFFS